MHIARIGSMPYGEEIPKPQSQLVLILQPQSGVAQKMSINPRKGFLYWVIA